MPEIAEATQQKYGFVQNPVALGYGEKCLVCGYFAKLPDGRCVFCEARKSLARKERQGPALRDDRGGRRR